MTVWEENTAGEVNYVSFEVQKGRVYVAFADGTKQNRAAVMTIEEIWKEKYLLTKGEAEC